MTDGIIKGTGNSRFIKGPPNFGQLYPTWESFCAAMAAGTVPIDLNGINELGWQVLATALNKANLLSDATAAILGLAGTATVNDALNSAFSTLVTTTNTANAAKSIADTANSTANSALTKANSAYSLASAIILAAGRYTGDGSTSRKIALSFTPKAVLVLANGYSLNTSNGAYGGFAVTGSNTMAVSIATNGFTVYYENLKYMSNQSGTWYNYIAFKF